MVNGLFGRKDPLFGLKSFLETTWKFITWVSFDKPLTFVIFFSVGFLWIKNEKQRDSVALK